MTRKILVPIDVSETELTQKVITWVEAQSRIDDAEIHFLTVVPVLPYYMSLGQGMVDLPDIHQLKNRAEKKLTEIATQFSLPEDRKFTHCVEGAPRDTILEMAKTLPADLVIISSHRPDITTYLLGSNAAAVVRHAECPVLVIR
ncbi:universal stress protein UspF [Shimwellia pseudoproteus]|uniref:universal stress protein UspF n=1 Tax=Shimwellia pseudoproteus TaxID=570012 RepID=UPI0018ED848B|nr:universal stress protein UspF [Shimwellia pseudoproteus]MBJ3817082.1 universal stress protein UspF [Shimwellia pseudoproteus]